MATSEHLAGVRTGDPVQVRRWLGTTPGWVDYVFDGVSSDGETVGVLGITGPFKGQRYLYPVEHVRRREVRSLVAHAGPVTLYSCGAFGAERVLARSAVVSVGKWAQYPAAVKIRYIEKGKRKEHERVFDRHPSLVILEGHDHPELGQTLWDATDGGRRTRYASFAPEWRALYESEMGAYLKKHSLALLGDYRGHVTTVPLVETPADLPGGAEAAS